MHVAALGGSAALLLSLLSVLGMLTGHAGFFSPRTTGPQPSSGVDGADPTPTHSPVTVSDWLQIAPTSMQFGCDDHQRTQLVVLENHGSRQVHWQANPTKAADQSTVNVSPGNGDLGPGESTAIQLQRTTNANGQQEVIRFAPTDLEAGSPAQLTVTAVDCT
jgi:hypothetical protein